MESQYIKSGENYAHYRNAYHLEKVPRKCPVCHKTGLFDYGRFKHKVKKKGLNGIYFLTTYCDVK